MSCLLMKQLTPWLRIFLHLARILSRSASSISATYEREEETEGREVSIIKRRRVRQGHGGRGHIERVVWPNGLLLFCLFSERTHQR